MSSGVFGTGLTFVQLIITIVSVFGGLIAFRITLSLDINKYLESRKEGYRAKCQNTCLHFEIIVDHKNQVQVHPFFVSPSGTVNYICQRCGLVRIHLDKEDLQRRVDYYFKNIDEYHKRNKKFHKLLKKAGQV